jgi:hypothetical protein
MHGQAKSNLKLHPFTLTSMILSHVKWKLLFLLFKMYVSWAHFYNSLKSLVLEKISYDIFTINTSLGKMWFCVAWITHKLLTSIHDRKENTKAFD